MLTKTVIQPSSGWAPIDLRELASHRELLYFLTWRDIKVRYKQTVLGAAWAVLQPLMMMAIFSVFFGRWAKIPSDGIAHPIFFYTGLLPWLYFANSVSNASSSLIGDSKLITKVYFPRVFIPMGATLAALLDYGIALALSSVMLAWYGITPDAGILLLPALVPIFFLAATGAGMLLSALNVQYRDVRYAIPFVIQIGLFLSLVIFPASVIPQSYRWMIYLNPMAGVVEAHRAAILPGVDVDAGALAISAASTAVLFVVGAFYFKRVERSFADVI